MAEEMDVAQTRQHAIWDNVNKLLSRHTSPENHHCGHLP